VNTNNCGAIGKGWSLREFFISLSADVRLHYINLFYFKLEDAVKLRRRGRGGTLKKYLGKSRKPKTGYINHSTTGVRNIGNCLTNHTVAHPPILESLFSLKIHNF
jgi:hypothetical protein